VPGKLSWLKHWGQVIGRVLGVVAKDGPAVIEYAEAITVAVAPQFAPAVIAVGGIASKILKQIVVTQASAAAIGTANTGPDKLKAVADSVGAEIDAWIASHFPGEAALSQVNKNKLIQTLYDIANEYTVNAVPAPVVPVVQSASTAAPVPPAAKTT
jgi:hypothetical protein